MVITQYLSEIVGDAFEKCSYQRGLGNVTVSNRPDLCQFQCNGAMSAAKQHRLPPIRIANEVVEKLKENDVFSLAEAVMPGFINLRLSDEKLASIMNDMAGDPRLSLPVMTPRSLVIDFGGPNIAKPLHVGHLRSAIIGDSLVRIARFLGHQVIGDVHLGDWGLQMGMVIAEMQREQPELVYFDAAYTGPYPETSPVTAEDMNVLYPRASSRAKADEAFAAKAAEATLALQDKRPGYYALWRHLWNTSVEDLKKNYETLGVHFDKWFGESDADAYIPKVLDLLREKNLLRHSEGAMVVDVELPDDREPMPPMVVVKSNGGDVYSTTDLGTLLQRMTDWSPDEVWYVVDNRQALHFKQVFRCAALAGFLGETKCQHIGFGTMNGKDGKPYKTRDGGVMRLSDMVEIVTSNAYEKVNASEVVGEDAEKRAVAKMVGIAAMKIGDLLNHRTKDYIFDMDRFLATDGKTGAYLQYTAVRIQSVLSKAEAAQAALGQILPPKSDTERDLMLALASASEALLRTYEDKAPNILCTVLFDIAGVFNKFYFENRILTCPDLDQRASWLSLLRLVQRMILTLLDLLGAQVPEHM